MMLHHRAALAIVVATAGSLRAAPPEKGVDVRFVPKDFVAAVIVQPYRIAKSPALADLPLGDLWDLIQKQTNVDPRKLDRAIFYIEPFPGGNVLFFPAVAIRFSEAVNEKKLFADALEKLEKKELAKGKEYLNSTTRKMAGVPISGYQIDERNFIFAPEPTIRKMLAAEESRTILNDRLKKIESDAEIILVLCPDPIRKELKQIIKENAGEIPEKWAAHADMPDQIDLITIEINLTGPLIRAVFETKNAASAKRLSGLLNDALRAAKPYFGQLRKLAQVDFPLSVQELVTVILDEVEKSTTIEQDDSKVVVRTPRTKAFDKAKKK